MKLNLRVLMLFNIEQDHRSETLLDILVVFN